MVSANTLCKKNGISFVLIFKLSRFGRNAADVVEPYPGRFTHHVLISGAGEIDGELMGWVKEAAVFSGGKR